SKKGAQDAHEAIRPTDVSLTPDRVRKSLSRDQARLYELIWKRFVACQMAPAVYRQTGVDISAGPYGLRATGSVLEFDGWLAVAGKPEESGDGLPELARGQRLDVLGIEARQHFTQPPPRFSEGTLVKELEEKGIGRPSTYATIIDTILKKKYVQKESGRLAPTELGRLVSDLLVESFPEIMDVEFTAGMESNLDEVEEGQKKGEEVLAEFYGRFANTLERAKQNMRDVKREEIPTEHVCDKCGKPMVVKWGRNGYFLACSGYPDCRNTREVRLHGDGRVEIVEQQDTGEVCEKCGRPMVFKNGRFGRFLACSGYPECKNTRAVTTGITCPECGKGQLVERRSKRGRVFYGCNGYPECRFSVFQQPAEGPCPDCGFGILVIRETKKDGLVLSCPQKGCSFKRPLGREDENKAAGG
ncbi:MAG: type I DNA topoisomerase, partial [Deltaproteobacteria bacterium]